MDSFYDEVTINDSLCILISSSLYIFMHILLFPAIWNRFFVPFYSTVVVLLIYNIYNN
jgi:hypothetical protein